MNTLKYVFFVYILPAIMLISFFNYRCPFAQEEEVPQEQPLIPKIDQLKEMRREQIKVVLANVLLERYMRPFDEWAKGGGYPRARLQQNDTDYATENWFALVIRDGLNDPIYIKFYLLKTYQKHDVNFAQSNEMVNRDIESSRNGLKSALEQTFILCLDNEDVRFSMIYGEAHLYQLVTKEQKIENLRKEDKLY